MSAALLVIDAQVGIIDEPENPVGNRDAFLDALSRLIGRARDCGLPVFHVQDDDVGPEGSAEWAIHPRVAPLPGEPVFCKRSPDSFRGTDLNARRRERGVTKLVIAGCQSEYCIDTACRSASSHGYDVILASDAHATKDNGVLTAAQIVAHVNRVFRYFDNLDQLVIAQRREDIDVDALARGASAPSA